MVYHKFIILFVSTRGIGLSHAKEYDHEIAEFFYHTYPRPYSDHSLRLIRGGISEAKPHYRSGA